MTNIMKEKPIPSNEDFKYGGKDVTFENLKKKAKKLQEDRIKNITPQKICGNCKYILPHRKDKFGFDADCKEIVIKSEMTSIADLVHINKEDKACDFFEPKQ